MQIALVIITFSLALGFMLRKFVWQPIFETRRKSQSLDGGRTKCGNTNCGCS